MFFDRSRGNLEESSGLVIADDGTGVLIENELSSRSDGNNEKRTWSRPMIRF